MCRKGLNVARLNFFHGTSAEHQKQIDRIKAARNALKPEAGDAVVVTGGNTNGESGNTNVIRIETIA